MRLADFIEANFEPILKEWEVFAASSGPAGRNLSREGLRNHAKEMLQAAVADLRTPQTELEQTEKSKGQAVAVPGAGETAAEIHGAVRAEEGFTVEEMTAEYRALRASVIRLWTKAEGSLTGENLEDLMRFNEHIDQSLAESLNRYAFDVKRAQEIYLGILGHDLRSPLAAVMMSSEFLLEAGELNELSSALATRIMRAGHRMNKMVKDLLDFTASRIGEGIPITKGATNLALLAEQAMEEIVDAHPKQIINLETSGNLRGAWDACRLGQVFSNLLSNAISHGAPKAAIEIKLEGLEKEIMISIFNYGPAIDLKDISTIFSPFKRLARRESDMAGHLGLGLYIVERIVTGHGGTILAEALTTGTRFTIRLPR